MDKLKNKYEVILGFVTLVISISAFKDELAKVNIDLGYTNISLATYFLYAVYGFSICLYLYIVEHIVRETKIGTWKIFNYAIWIAFGLFCFILLTPILIILNVVTVKIYYGLTTQNGDDEKKIFSVLKIILILLNVVVSTLTSIRFRRNRKEKIQEDISKEEIIELENATKLFNDGYYSNSVLESFKVLETHLYKQLTNRNYRVPRYKLNEIIQLALRNGVLIQEDIPAINDLRGMRNIAAHTDTTYTKQQAEFALDFVKQLLVRNEKNATVE